MIANLGSPMNEIITSEMEEIKNLIIQTAARRNALKLEMENWFKNNAKRFPNANELITVDSTLSELDNHYKRLWDYHNGKSKVS